MILCKFMEFKVKDPNSFKIWKLSTGLLGSLRRVFEVFVISTNAFVLPLPLLKTYFTYGSLKVPLLLFSY